MKILVPLDGSDTAAAVLPFAIELARKGQGKLVLATVVQSVGAWDVTLSKETLENEERFAAQYLEEQIWKLREAGVGAESRIARGEAADGVLGLAEETGADLIAISTHGRSGLTRWLFGSVASRVLEGSTVPVMLLRPKTGEDKGAPGPVINKVLVPLDGSDLAASVVPFVEGFARKQGASLVFFSAVAPITTYPGYESSQAASIGDVMQEIHEQAKEITSRAAEESNKRGLEATFAVSLDTAVEGTLRAAEDLDVDLIAIATHGRGGLGRAVLGSVADGIVRRSADRPVLVIRPQN